MWPCLPTPPIHTQCSCWKCLALARPNFSNAVRSQREATVLWFLDSNLDCVTYQMLPWSKLFHCSFLIDKMVNGGKNFQSYFSVDENYIRLCWFEFPWKQTLRQEFKWKYTLEDDPRKTGRGEGKRLFMKSAFINKRDPTLRIKVGDSLRTILPETNAFTY